MKSFDEVVQEIIQYADEQGTRDNTLLDEEVHNDASNIASNINNGGIEEQVKYLLTNRGLSNETVSYIKFVLTQEGNTSTEVCLQCGNDLNTRNSIRRCYINKDKDSPRYAQGHYDENGNFEPDSMPDLSDGRYDLLDNSDRCAACGENAG